MIERLKSLYKISQVLNTNEIVWGLGGSQCLLFKGLVDTARDLDIFILEADYQRALECLRLLSTDLRKKKPISQFFSKYCYELSIDGIMVDLMAVFIAVEPPYKFQLNFDETRISQWIALEDEQVPLMALEDWWAIYWMIGREKRGLTIEESFIQHRVDCNLNLLLNNLQQNLPDWLKRRGTELLSSLDEGMHEN